MHVRGWLVRSDLCPLVPLYSCTFLPILLIYHSMYTFKHNYGHNIFRMDIQGMYCVLFASYLYSINLYGHPISYFVCTYSTSKIIR